MIELVNLPEGQRAAWRDAVERRMLDRRLSAGVRPAWARESVAWQLARSEQISSQPWSVCDDGTQLGTAWTLAREEVAHLLDLDVSADRATETLDALLATLGGAGVTQLVVDLFAGDTVSAAALAGRGVPLEATQMQLDLSLPVAPPPRVELRPMTDPEHAVYDATSVAAYAADLLASGAYPDLAAATASAERQTAELLPRGRDTPGHRFWTAYDRAEPVGILWLAVTDGFGFIYDIEVHADRRRRGYGREILDAAALASRALGAELLGLNVFGNNDGARTMYEEAGYSTTERTYRLRL